LQANLEVRRQSVRRSRFGSPRKANADIQSAIALRYAGALQILGAKKPKRASSVAVPFD